MKSSTNKHIEAKLTALRDITEDLKKERARLGIGAWSEFAPVNYILHERDICEYLGIPAPDFRVFNGGHNKERKKI